MVQRYLWKTVGGLLNHADDEIVHRYVIKKASMIAKENDLSTYIIPNCRIDELESNVRVLVDRGF